ncbi:MAG: site-specific DNA-methyltransferase, partial [Acidobacteria bacterium]|nr:site-specific DNA-methyltransferase [Acidobacteriota bacterium]
MIDQYTGIIDAVHSSAKVRGLTHNFYRYPARFSPQFAHELIQQFSQPGDTVLDPFMGGGTAIIEALSLGRRAIGVDLNSL